VFNSVPGNPATGTLCFALIGLGKGNDAYTAGHTFSTQLSGIKQSVPVLMTDPATMSFSLSLDEYLKASQVAGFGANQQPTQPAVELFAQVVMWNPIVFPQNPEQWSRVLKVKVFQDGRVTGSLSGDRNGIDLQVQSQVSPDGTATLTFPFQIDGM